LILTAVMTAAISTVGFADGLYWVVGSRAHPQMPDRDQQSRYLCLRRWRFLVRDGPYRSLADARLARSTIGACPKEDPRGGLNQSVSSEACPPDLICGSLQNRTNNPGIKSEGMLRFENALV